MYMILTPLWENDLKKVLKEYYYFLNKGMVNTIQIQ